MIDDKTFILSEKNFYQEDHQKKYIVIGNSFNVDMNHFNGWKTRSNGGYKKVSHFTIDIEGKVYQHFPIKYYSDFLRNSLYNKNIISVTLVNQGWFDYDIKDRSFFNYYGLSFSGDMTERRWRNHSFWQDYTENQLNSLVDLTVFLIKSYNIPKTVLTHNTFVKEIHNFMGVSYRSNWVKDCTDLNPSFNFTIFKNKVEDNGL